MCKISKTDIMALRNIARHLLKEAYWQTESDKVRNSINRLSAITKKLERL